MIQKICDIDPEVIAKAEKFRMRKEQNIAALICKYYDSQTGICFTFGAFTAHDRRKTKIKATTKPIDQKRQLANHINYYVAIEKAWQKPKPMPHLVSLVG